MPAVLRAPRVRRILVAFTINRLGTFIGIVALLAVVYDRTGSAVAVSALLLAWQAVPAFAVPALVARVEASPHGRELTALYLFEAAATAGLAVTVSRFWLPAVLVLAVLDGTAALAANALLRAALGRAALEDSEREPSEDLEQKANAALNIGFSITFVGGPAVGGAIVAAAGAPAALLVDVGSFVICGLALLDVRTHVEEAAGDTVRARLRAARDYVQRHASLRTLLLVYTVALALFETAAPIEVAFAKSTLAAGSQGLGLLLTAWGGGAVLGSLVFARIPKHSLALLLSIGTLAIGLADGGFALAPNLALGCVAAVVGGVGNGIELPALMGLVQQLAPREMHGRLIGAVESLTALSLAFGLAVGGVLVAASSVRTAFAIVAVATVATAALLLRLAQVARSQATTAVAVAEQ